MYGQGSKLSEILLKTRTCGIRSSFDDASTKCHFIGVMEFISRRHTTSKSRDCYSKILKSTVDIICCSISFHRRRQCKHHLVNRFIMNTLHKAFDCQVIRSDSIYRRNNTAKHMVKSTELLSCLDAHHVPHVLNHADCVLVSRVVRTNRTNILIRNHAARAAITDIVSELVDGRREMMDVLLRLTQKVERKPERALAADARKRVDRIHGIFQKFRRIFFLVHN